MSDHLGSAVVILLAAGAGTRVGLETPKQLQMISGKTLVQWVAETYRHAGVLCVVHHELHHDSIREAVLAASPTGEVMFVAGGPTRRHSIANALAALDSIQHHEADLVVLQNAASPGTPVELVEQCLAAAAETGAAQAYIPCHHTVVRLADAAVDAVIPRDQLGYTADPTVYKLAVLRQAMTDGATEDGETTLDLVRRQGTRITAVESPRENIKVTVPADLGTITQKLAQEIGPEA